MTKDLEKREAGGGRVVRGDGGFIFELPATPSRKYALAQLDDYMHLRRGAFPHRRPVSLQLNARVSGPCLPGTWGFGFWNDPFSAGFGAGGMRRILPVLPNAAWFFYGSNPNYLSLRDGLPGKGFHAGVFRSPLLPSFLSLAALPALPFFLWPTTARVLRRLAQIIVKEDAASLPVNVTELHQYQLRLTSGSVAFSIDQETVFKTQVSPLGRLGLVIWIDNQYFKFTPDGKISLGFLPTGSEQVMHVQNLTLVEDSGYH